MRQQPSAFGEQDPLSAVLVQPGRPGAGGYLEELFATGREEVEAVFAVLEARGITIGTGRALDFGCGVGRLTRGLADRFDACDGVDLSASLIESARELSGDGDRVRFHHTTCADLRLFSDASFDFILALTGLRHTDHDLTRAYLREFLRLLRPGGVAFVNLPERLVPPHELSRQGWQATLTAIESISALGPGEVSWLTVSVHNDSPVPWSGSAELRIGTRWRKLNGDIVASDDTGPVIGGVVNPGESYDAKVWVVAPPTPGGYELEVDLGQTRFGWFSDRSSRPLKFPVTVVAEPVSPTPATSVGEGLIKPGEQDQPVLWSERHLIARDDVVATVEDAGGFVVEAVQNDRSDPSAQSLDYVVARTAAPLPMRSRDEPQDQQAVLEARIRRAATQGAQSGAPSLERLSADALTAGRRATALRMIEERADLVGFGLSSRWSGLGRVSTVVREGLRRALLQVLSRQTEFNRSSGDLIRGHDVQLEALGATVLAQVDIQSDAEDRLDELERRLERLEVDSARLASRAAGRAIPSVAADLDYLSFTERFHGTIQQRREHLGRFVSRFEGQSEVIDAGCGRGAFLELLREANIAAVGVDSDQATVASCRRRGLDVVHADVLQFLRARPDNSQGGIFASHLIEHLERGEIVEFVRVAFRKLSPGGVLVLEAINPMCLLTYAGFYGDFTSIAPVSPPALEWLADSCGFSSVAIEGTSPVPPERRLRPLPATVGGGAEVEAFDRGIGATNELLFGFQEYALTAHKPG